MTEQSNTLRQAAITQVDRVNQVSGVLGKLLMTANDAGVGSRFEGELECLELKEDHLNFCAGLKFQDFDAYVNCMASPRYPTETIRIFARVENKLVKLDPKLENSEKPTLVITTVTENSQSCTATLLYPPALGGDVQMKMTARKSAIDSVAIAAAESIDIQRASLIALYQLYTEAHGARRVLLNRLALTGEQK